MGVSVPHGPGLSPGRVEMRHKKPIRFFVRRARRDSGFSRDTPQLRSLSQEGCGKSVALEVAGFKTRDREVGKWLGDYCRV